MSVCVSALCVQMNLKIIFQYFYKTRIGIRALLNAARSSKNIKNEVGVYKIFCLIQLCIVISKQLVRINLPLFSTVVPSSIYIYINFRPFVVITTLSTGLVGVEVTSVSWLGLLT